MAAALAWAASAPAEAQVARAGQTLDDGPNPYDRPLARTIVSIVQYSRWPTERQVVRLCIAGPSEYGERFKVQPLSGGRELRPVSVPPTALGPARCDVVYLGRLSLDEQRRIMATLLGTPVLTIAENDPACRSRAMVCLLFEANEMSFRINVDAISRSQVRIDPRVLRMSDGPGGN